RLERQRGHSAIGGLIVEALVRVLPPVLLPAVAGMVEKGDVGIASLPVVIGITIGKEIANIALMMLVVRRLLRWLMARSA
ncbi:cation:proton antiport protein, partial [Salmonella enterica subsp. enterica serovar Poona]